MRRARLRIVSRPRAALWGTAVLFVGVQVALAAFLTRVHPEVCEPEYGSLANTLRTRLAEAPGRPLVLILGSSRSANIFRPSPPAGPDPLVFNFGTLWTGPVRQLQMLRRLLARGVRPRWVVAEVWPPFLTQRGGFAEELHIRDCDLQLGDAPLVAHYFSDRWPAYAKLAEGLLAPAFSYRAGLLACYAPFPHRPAPREPGDWSDPALRAVEGYGWLPAPDEAGSPAAVRDRTNLIASHVTGVLTDFDVSPLADRALRELLSLCARHQIRTMLVFLPDHSAVRACYLPEVQARLHAYLGGVAREHAVTVIDTRDWVVDDDFIDGKHTHARVAAPFTERFGREALRPWMDGRPLPPHLLLGSSPSLSAPALTH
jgi:hypothetical protein